MAMLANFYFIVIYFLHRFAYISNSSFGFFLFFSNLGFEGGCVFGSNDELIDMLVDINFTSFFYVH
jgi:hypothetical protein